MRFSRNLASFHNYCHPPRLISVPNYRTRGSGQRSWTQGWRSQTEGEIFKGTDGACANPSPRIFPATGSRSSVAFQSNSTGFYGHNAAFFGTFLGSKKVPSLLVPFVLFFRDCAAADFVVYYKPVCLVRARAAAITLGMISIGENRYAV